MANNNLGGALIAGASVLGGISSMINQNKAIKAQQEENERTRQFNLNLAKQQNAWNIEQWNRENAYNSPAAVAARLESAGYNRNLALGNLPLQSAPSPVMTAGAPAQSADMSALKTLPSLGDMTSDFLNKKLVAAQIDKIQSETKGQNEQNKILATEREIKDLTKGNVIELAGLNVQLKSGEITLNKTQNDIGLKKLDEMGWHIEEFRSNVEKNYAQAANVDEDTIKKRLDNQAFSKRFELEMNEGAARIKDLLAGANIKNAQAKEVYTMLPYMIDHMISDTKLINEKQFETYANRTLTGVKTIGERERNVQEILRTNGLRLTNKGLELDNSIKGKQNSWYNFDKTLNAANGIFDLGVKASSMYFNYMSGASKAISAGLF